MIKFLMMIFQMFMVSSKSNEEPKQEAQLPDTTQGPVEIDWTNPDCMISKYFTVRNAIYFPKWKRLAVESDSLTQDAKDALVKLFTEVMDPIRELIGKPIKVHVSFRSPDYNVLIGGAKMSIHMARKYDNGDLVAACDWSADLGKQTVGENCDEIKKILKPHLADLNIRLEDNGDGATWIHVDNRKPGPGGRFFKP